ACGMSAIYSPELAQQYLAEAIYVARAAGDRWSLCQILSYQASVGDYAGEPIAAIAAAQEGRDLADALGDRFFSRTCRFWLSVALSLQGDLAQGCQVARALVDKAEAAGDHTMTVFGHVCHAAALFLQGHAAAAQAAAQSAQATAATIGGFFEDTVYALFANAALVGGDAPAASLAAEEALRHTVPARELFIKGATPLAEAALADGDLVTARRWADDVVAVVPGWYQMQARTVRAFVAIAQGQPEQAERDAHEALAVAARTQAYTRVADTFECLARLAADDGNHQHAVRLLGAAEAARQRIGDFRFPMYQAGYDAVVAAAREALGQSDFNAAWAEGAALSVEEAIAYAQRGRGERKRPTSGWGSLTPTERDVVGLVREGLPNKDIAARLFISPRTVQSHLTHVYAKLGVASRMQLVQGAGRHT
ncbi:helix-turn-helix transcriptional regulator, partial [Mycobacterium sp.]|uniref:helix-turn-helix transcriptional regulator n=1 Tax=Mycobacterium sp. TaxID=1785 RepID=UPI003C766EF7